MSLSSLPHTLWHLYLDHLVFYKPGSWVDKIASTCRVLAFATIVPFVILTLLVCIMHPVIWHHAPDLPSCVSLFPILHRRTSRHM